MYVHDNATNVYIHADDTTIYDINKSRSAVEMNLQAALNNVSTWCHNNGIWL